MDDKITVAAPRRDRSSGREPHDARAGELGSWLDRYLGRHHGAIPIGGGAFRVRGRRGPATVYHDADGDLVVETADHYHFPRDLEDLGRVLRAAGVR